MITVRQAELGEIMVPGTPVLTLADLDHIWLRAYINETDIGKIRLDQTATVKTDTYPGKSYQGPRFLHFLRRRVHAEERRNPRRTRHAGLPHQDRHRQSDP